MAKKRKTEGLDDILKGKADEFESGRERQIDSELDDLVWELGHYEDREAAGFRSRGIPPRGQVRGNTARRAAYRNGARGWISRGEAGIPESDGSDGPPEDRVERTDLELACGEVPIRLKEKVLEHCSRKNISPADIWYDEKAMKKGLAKLDTLAQHR